MSSRQYRRRRIEGGRPAAGTGVIERMPPGRRRLAIPPPDTDLPADFQPLCDEHVERLLSDGARWSNDLHNAAVKAARADYWASRAVVVNEGPPRSPLPDGGAEPVAGTEPETMDLPVGEVYSPPSTQWIEQMIQWRTALVTGPFTELRFITPPAEPGGKPIRRARLYANDADGIRESVLHALEWERTPGAVVCEQTQALRDDRLDVPRLNKRGKPTAFTATTDVSRRTRLVIDVDPQTDKGGATRDALKVAREIRVDLEDVHDWPSPAVISSGRGFHLIWAIDLPVGDGDLVKGFLECLNAYVDSDRVVIDPAMANPCQIRRIPGVLNHKSGKRSRVLRLPDRLEVVSTGQIQGVIDFIVDTLGYDPRTHRKVYSGEDARVESDGTRTWIFRRCPLPGAIEPSGGSGGGPKRLYVDAAIRDAVESVEAAETGSRRNALFAQTCAVIELLNAGFGDPEAAYQSLFFAGLSVGLDHGQVSEQLRGAAERVGTKARDLSGVREIRKPTLRFGNGFDDGDFDGDDDDESPSPDGQADPDPVDHPGGGDESLMAFPVEVFPPILERYCVELAGSMDASTNFTGLSMLTVAGAAIGHAVNLRVKKTWLEGPQIWGVLAGPPGTLKSPVMEAVAAPFTAVNRSLRGKAGTARREWLKKSKESKKGNTGGDPGPEPPRLAATVGDVTMEALAVLLRDNPRGLLSVQDEAVGWVASFDAYKKGGGERQFLLSLHSFREINIDRKTDGQSINAPRPGCGLLTGIQPDLLPRLVSADGNDGFTERLLIVLHESDGPPGITDDEVSDESLEAWGSTIRGLAGAKMMEDRGALRPWECLMTPEADARFKAWFKEWAARWWSVEPLREFINKSKGQTLRLALILSRLRLAVKGESITGSQHDPSRKVPPVELVDVEGAIKLMAYFLNHRRRVIPSLNRRSGNAMERRILGWIRRGGLTEFKQADLFDALKLKPVEGEAVAALTALVERGVLHRLPDPPSGGRGRKPSPSYEVVDLEAAA